MTDVRSIDLELYGHTNIRKSRKEQDPLRHLFSETSKGEDVFFSRPIDEWKNAFDQNVLDKGDQVPQVQERILNQYLDQKYGVQNLQEVRRMANTDTKKVKNGFMDWLVKNHPNKVTEMVNEAANFLFTNDSVKDDMEMSAINDFTHDVYRVDSPADINIGNNNVRKNGVGRDFLLWLMDSPLSRGDAVLNRLVNLTKQARKEEKYRVQRGVGLAIGNLPGPVHKTAGSESEKVETKNDIWPDGETLLKTKHAIFDSKDPENNLIKVYKDEFLKEKYGTKTLEGAMGKILESQNYSVGENVIKDILASDLLNWLKAKGKTGPIESIEKYAQVISKPEKLRESKESGMVDGVANIKLNENALEKFVENEEDKKTIRLFVDRWENSDVGWLGFDVANSKDDPKVKEISNITLVTKAGERITIPAHLFRMVFKNVHPSLKPNTNTVTGFSFTKSDGVIVARVHPGKKVEEVKESMGRVKMGDISLPDDTIYFIG